MYYIPKESRLLLVAKGHSIWRIISSREDQADFPTEQEI